MKERLIHFLCCPLCKSELRLTNCEYEGQEIKTGTLTCKECKTSFQIVDYVPRFFTGPAYCDSFSLEWKLHNETQLANGPDHENYKSFQTRVGFDKQELKGRLTLDAGCGMGRYTDIAEKHGAEVVALDATGEAVESAMKNVGFRNRVHVVQANLENIPLKEGLFDYVFSLGVLHHTPEPYNSFKTLLPHVKKDGYLAVSVYSRDSTLYNKSHFLRRFTTKINPNVLYIITSVCVFFLYPVYKIKPLRLFYRLFPICMHPDRKWRSLDTYDTYAHKYQHTFTYYDIFRWFKNCGFHNIEVLEAPVSMKGQKR